MYTIIATTGDYGLDVRTFDRYSLAVECLEMLRDRLTTRRVALYQGDALIVAYQRRIR